MRVEVVAVGDELLVGEVVDVNLAEVGRQLSDAGLQVAGSRVVGDDVGAIADAVTAACSRAEAVIVGGGLGPTSDDLTREALARLVGAPLRRDRGIEQRLRATYADRGAVLTPGVLRQADVPEGAVVLRNLTGTAPGIRLDLAGARIYAVPGVPAELAAMVADRVVPDLLARSDGPGAVVTRVLRTAVAGESVVARLLGPLESALPDGLRVAYLAEPGEVRVKLGTVAGANRDRETARTRLAPVLAEAAERLGDIVYADDDTSLDTVVHRLLAARSATVAVAESLTGGLLGAALTAMPGSSATFAGGVVAYATRLKVSLLGVDGSLLEAEGAVHADVARQMAVGVRERLAATYSVATTGVAGPESQGGRPVGTVYVAVAGPGGVVVSSGLVAGERERVRRITVVRALDLLRRVLSGLPAYDAREHGG